LVSLPTLHTPCYSTVSRIVIGTGPMEMKRRGDDGATRRWANSSGPRLIVCGRSAISTRGDGMPTRNNAARMPRCTSPSHSLLIHPFFSLDSTHPPILNQSRRRAFSLHSFATQQKAELAEGASSAHEEG
jgi:hypothetical protein